MITKQTFRAAGYRVKRATTVLAAASATVKEMDGQAGDGMRSALDAVRAKNYDFELVDGSSLERIYARFDDEFAAKVLSEYRFVPERGSCRDNVDNTGICALCGKGDSRDDGANEDHIRYEFKLTNDAGGEDVWTGSTCIVNHALKVQGAETSDEARRILERALREHISWWKQEQWRAEHGDHADIPGEWQEFRFLPRDVSGYYGASYRRNASGLAMVRVDVDAVRREVARLYQAFRTAARFYERKTYLTEKKTATWEEARALLATVRRADTYIRGAAAVQGADAKFAYWCACAAAVEEEMEKSKAGEAVQP